MDLKIAYKPNLALVDSHVAIYKIYVLKNPFTNEVFYVGQTFQELNIRLSGHVNETGPSNRPKKEYVKTIVDQGRRPIIEAVETIKGKCYIDKLFVNEREIFWVKYYKSVGVRLLNAALMSNSAECREFKAYVRSVEEGQRQYHYYFCGKTHAGHAVYDEEKMHADGFALPAEQSSIVKIVEKIKVVERVVYSVSYIEKPTVRTEYLSEDGFEQPGWTRSFALSIPPDDSGENFDSQMDDDSDWELDCDSEPDYDNELEEEEEDADFEPGGDEEEDFLEEDEPELSYFDSLEVSI